MKITFTNFLKISGFKHTRHSRSGSFRSRHDSRQEVGAAAEARDIQAGGEDRAGH